MKINFLKINGFGKLINQEIKLENNINLIYGKNESGKSTLLKFISGMFYGLSKNKEGNSISDFDKFKPWNLNEFSGKIKYSLDNGETYEIFREFSKKKPIIYNGKMEDITNQFNMDRTKGSEFFFEQTGIEEKLLFTTWVVEQQGVVLNENSQNILTQKITNLLTTGDDNISYKKTIEKLRQKLINEVGTDRTVGRPINVVNSKIEKINNEKKLLEEYENKKEEMIFQKEKIKKEIKEKEEIINKIKKAKEIKEKLNIEEEKIKIQENTKKEYRAKINLIILTLLIILNIFVGIFNFNKYIIYGTILFTIIYLCLSLMNYIKKKSKKRKESNEEHSVVQKKEELGDIINKSSPEINNLLEEETEKQNENKLKLNTIEIEEKNILNKLESKAEYEEELENLNNQKEELIKLESAINLTITTLETSYDKMKDEITPKFTNSLSTLIENISGGKYRKAVFSDEEGLRVELESGEYINNNLLSLGTIDQLYLSLRLSSITSISKEKMPIILDEAFVYYDNKRLENILKFLNDNYKNNQIIIFTCAEREKNMMDKSNIKYNFIEI